MKKPPATLDGARVLWWAWSGEVPFGELPGADVEDRQIFGFAICRYEEGEFYRFTCNEHWHVVQDEDHRDEDEAKSDIPLNFDRSRIVWERYG